MDYVGALEDGELKNFGRKIVYRIFVPALVVVLISPTKNDLALIIGGHYVVQAATAVLDLGPTISGMTKMSSTVKMPLNLCGIR